MAEQLLIYGNGQMAELSYARLRRDRRYAVVAFTVDGAVLRERELCGLPVIAFEDVERQFPPSSARMFVAVGPLQGNRVRADRYLQAKKKGYRFVSQVSPRAVVDPGVQVGENCSIGDNVVIDPYVRIGDDVWIGTGAVIGHHSSLGDHCFVGVNCTVLGSVRVGPFALLGAGSVIRDQISLGQASIVGVGATIVRDTASDSVHVAPEAVHLPISSARIRI
ncbi:MAG: acetyltransferase [Burkholderiales bacterium]|nr:MAG: acetyltransferase [Burkholderiales bacterium]